jgi:hypothetical protein
MVIKSMKLCLVDAILFAAVTSYAGIPTDGIVARFMFSGNAIDSSGNGNDGMPSAITPSPDRFGKENQAFWFDGVSSSILIDSAKGLPSGNHAKSISLWFKSGDISSTNLMVLAGFGSRTNTDGASFQIGHDFQGWRINGYGDEYDWRTKVEKPDYLDTLWHHCAVTYDASITNVYFDGTLKASTGDFHYATAAERIIIGKEIDLYGWNFKGYLDDIIFYDRALSESEVKALYLVGGYFIIDMPFSLDQRPAFYWHHVPGVDTYTIVIDTFASFTKPLFDVKVSDTTFTPSTDLPYGTIYWKVVTDKNNASRTGVCIIWEPSIPFIIQFNPELVFNSRPIFRWHKVRGAVSYTIVIDTNLQFSFPILSVAVNDTTFQPQASLPEDTMYWKVKSDLIPEYSPVSRFIIKMDSVPFLYRFNGANCRNPITFRWRSMEKVASYWIQIDTVRTFGAPYISLPLSDTLYKPAIMLLQRRYYWRVSSSINLSRFSPIDSLYTMPFVDIAPYSREGDQAALLCGGIAYKNGALYLTIPWLSRSGMVSLYDMQGRKIGCWEIPATAKKISAARIPLRSRRSNVPRKGLYFVKAEFGSKTACWVIPIAD